MSVPGVSVTISGMDSMQVLDQNLAILAGFKPLGKAQMDALREAAGEGSVCGIYRA